MKNEGLERFKESLAVYGICLQEVGNVFKAVANSLMPKLVRNKFQQKRLRSKGGLSDNKLLKQGVLPTRFPIREVLIQQAFEYLGADPDSGR